MTAIYSFYLSLNLLCVHCSLVNDSGWTSLYNDHVEYATVLDSVGNRILVARRNMLFLTTDGGKSWSPHSELPVSVLIRQIIAFDPCGQRILVNEINGSKERGVLLTRDGGLSYQKVLNGSAKGEAMFYTKDTSLIVCVSSKPLGIWCSTDYGDSWSRHPCKGISNVDSIGVCTVWGTPIGNRLRLIVGMSHPGWLLISDDTGRSFSKVMLPSEFVDSEIPQITDGSRPGELYACMALSNRRKHSGIFKSEDYGNTWDTVRSPSSLWCVLADKHIQGRLWVGQYGYRDALFPDSSILESDDFGHSWKAFGNKTGKLNWLLRFTADERSLFLASEEGLSLAHF